MGTTKEDDGLGKKKRNNKIRRIEVNEPKDSENTDVPEASQPWNWNHDQTKDQDPGMEADVMDHRRHMTCPQEFIHSSNDDCVHGNRPVGEWIHERKRDRKIEKWMDEWMIDRLNGWMNEKMNEWMDKNMRKW